MTAAAAFNEPIGRPANSRAQDLMLLAKGHYRANSGIRPAEAARLLIGYHNLHDPQRMNWPDAAHCVLGDLREAGLLQELLANPHSLHEMLLRDMAPSGFGSVLGPDYTQPGGYHAVLIQALLTRAMLAKAREDGAWLLAIPECTPDPQIEALLNSEVAR